MRTDSAKKARVKTCNEWKKKPLSHFTGLDLIMDNKKWKIPRTAAAKRYQRMRSVRFHLRTRGEGLKPGCTKPSAVKNRVNPGGATTVCAGIINGRIRLWHYLPSSTWSAKAAEALYRGPVAQALRRHRGSKRSYRILEDNDPTGYKSKLAQAAKEELKIAPIVFPAYSPDLNPLDFFVWAEVERRMAKQKVPKDETIKAYKARLRRTAMNIPAKIIRKAVASIRTRAAAVAKARGGDIPRD